MKTINCSLFYWLKSNGLNLQGGILNLNVKKNKVLSIVKGN